MSATWLTLLFTAWLLGECQSSLPDEFAPPATSHEAGKVNNVTLTPPGHSVVAQGNAQDFDRDLDQDPLTPHAAPSSQRKLSRGKRFVAFPQGSSASGAVCLTTGVIGNPNLLYLSLGINWGVAYDLPNVTWVLQNAHGWTTKKSAQAQIKRRHRRELYGRLETMIDSMGYNGRDCILRTLCESRQYFQRTKMSMVGEMLRTIFSLPKQRIFTRELHENADIVHYDQAYRNAHTDDCTQYNCHFSLLELAFGKYTTPPKNYYA
uniref:Uncharacterized protein, isoform C n=1 Tax=Drosophila melanogaster TaxID=7227 RepID=Q9VC77_DROME|nr:uncharacterized protein Dmel_CG5768, isoform C [Drosophila melanogaster]AAF56298.3 uncharacterized protein Dmel_CG5768, isoform C [Drosophila melanogaster]|eukprot:NP_651260.3 uncharacterized protein Dmel_CG5768, isoform C [Drosophila melanogaster]